MSSAVTALEPQQSATPVAPRGRSRWPVAALVATVLGGAAVRLAGVWWGLPARLHPDEWAIVEGAIDMARRNSFEPPYFMRPDHVEMKLDYLAFVAYAHLVHGAPAEVVFATDPSPFVVIARVVTALFGVASILVAYAIGRRFSPGAGLAAAFLVAFFPPYVEHARYATPDVPVTTAFLCVVLACVHYVQRPGWRPLLLASLAVSAAVAIKYPGAVGALVIAVAVVAAAARDRAWLRIVRHGLAAVATVVVGLFVISPALFTNVSAVVVGIKGETRTGHVGADGLGYWGNLWFYAGSAARSAGVVVLVLAVVGGVWAVRARRLEALPLLGGAALWVMLAAVSLHWARWGLPMHTAVLLLAALGAPVALRWAPRLGAAPGVRRLVRPAVLAVAAVAGLTLVVASVATAVRFVVTDTRVLSAGVLAAQGVTPEESVFEGYTPFSPGQPGLVFDAFTLDGERLEPVVADGAARPRYLVLSSEMDDRFTPEPRYDSQRAFYRRIEEQMPLVAAFRPVPALRENVLVVPTLVDAVRYLHGLAEGGMSGPTIRVYEIPAAGA